MSKNINILEAHKILARGEMAARRIGDNVESVKGLKALLWDVLCLQRAANLRAELEPEWATELVAKQEAYNKEHPRQDGKAHYPVDAEAAAMLALVLYTGKMKKSEKPAAPAPQGATTTEGKGEF